MVKNFGDPVGIKEQIRIIDPLLPGYALNRRAGIFKKFIDQKRKIKNLKYMYLFGIINIGDKKLNIRTCYCGVNDVIRS